jgi:hypothetical protein
MTTLPLLAHKMDRNPFGRCARSVGGAHRFYPKELLRNRETNPQCAEEYRPGIPDHEINREKVITAFYDVSGMRIKYHKSVCAIVMAEVPSHQLGTWQNSFWRDIRLLPGGVHASVLDTHG